LLGIGKLRSEDSVRRAFEKQNEEALTLWMDRQMNETYAALLDQQWVLDLDATVKTLYGRQEEARVGYNPMKPGRPSHVYHAMVLTAAKLVLNVDAEAGNRIASAYGQPSLWGWLESRERKDWPTLVRGDIAYGNEEMMAGCEQRGLAQCRTGLGRRRAGVATARLDGGAAGDRVAAQAGGSAQGRAGFGAAIAARADAGTQKRRVVRACRAGDQLGRARIAGRGADVPRPGRGREPVR
jgi:hypothetical protein